MAQMHDQCILSIRAYLTYECFGLLPSIPTMCVLLSLPTKEHLAFRDAVQKQQYVTCQSTSQSPQESTASTLGQSTDQEDIRNQRDN
jgi:hypothetical protein